MEWSSPDGTGGTSSPFPPPFPETGDVGPGQAANPGQLDGTAPDTPTRAGGVESHEDATVLPPPPIIGPGWRPNLPDRRNPIG